MRGRKAARRRLAPLLALGAFVAAGCGRKLPPEAPLQVIPARPSPLRLTQEGSDVVLRFPFPTTTAQGETLTNLTGVTVYRETLPAAPGAKAPGPPAGAEREREEKGFRLRAEKLALLSPSEIDDSTVGSEIVVRDSLYPLYAQKRLGRIILRYAVTATRDRKRVSELSPLVSLLPRVPPAEPLGLLATVEETRVCLDWVAPAAMLDGSGPPVVAGYAVYRREEKEDGYGEPIGLSFTVPTYIDGTVKSGKRYLYTVRASPARELPMVLGPPADELLVDTKDVFPPGAPEGLLVLAEDAGNRLVWNPSLAADLAGYAVYRLDPALRQWVPLAEGLKDPAYFDAGGAKGARYAVGARDLSGNESPRAEASAGQEPRR